MQSEIRDRINAAVGLVRQYRAEAEALIAEHGASSPEVAEKLAAAERAYADVEALKRLGDVSDREHAIDAWRSELDTRTPVVIERHFTRPDDPTSTVEYREAFMEYARKAARGEDTSVERRVLTIASDGAGGYTVPADVRAGILARLPAYSNILGKVNQFTTSRDIAEWPAVAPHGSSPSIYTSAFVGSMVGETPAETGGENEPSFQMLSIPVEKARSKARVSMDLAADSEFDIMAFLASDGAVNLALVRESQIIAGSGVGKNVKGIVEYTNGDDTITTVDVEGTTANTISNTTSDLGSASKLIACVYAVPEQYRRLPSFAIGFRSEIEEDIRKLVDAQGRFLWSAGFAATPDNILGYPLVRSPFFEDGGTDGNVVVVPGAWDQVAVPVRSGISVQVLVERYAEVDQIAIILRQRFGMGVANRDAFRLGIV